MGLPRRARGGEDPQAPRARADLLGPAAHRARRVGPRRPGQPRVLRRCECRAGRGHGRGARPGAGRGRGHRPRAAGPVHRQAGRRA
ncbi:hypothetical protein G5V59_08990 [Nocardioides sp. W3-2-3]|uniref:hypothetical protein n=1 Tax=Nocardioides convexus TaxID=2712224 RepID=UPI002418AFA5|nr:hypothetical protein [Nocardioides convexus]NHA00221.1 hypothetical protein [Nocardioides convexus]